MSGTAKGGKQALATFIQQHGLTPDGRSAFHVAIGAKGGQSSNTGGFAAGEEGRKRAAVYGKLGGTISRKGNSAAMQKARAEARKRIKAEQLEANYKKLQKIAQRGQKRGW
jgi:hypothetical protein